MARKVEYVHFPRGVRVTKHADSRGFFRVRFTRPDGRDGEARRSTWQAAEQLAHELAGLLAQQAPDNVEHAEQTIAELCEVWLELGVGSATYRKSSKTYVRNYIMPTVGDLRCSQWDLAVTRLVVAALEERGYAPSTISSVVRTMSSIARCGRERGYLPADATPTKAAFRHQKSYVDLADLPRAEDVDKLAAAAAEVCGEEWRAVQMYAGAYSGLRIGEVLGLKVGDVNLDDGTIRVDRQLCAASSQLIPPKYDSRRTTIIPVWLDEQWRELVEHRDPEEPAFPARRGGFEGYSTWYNQRWRPTATAIGWLKAGESRWTFHDLRHYFCTWALSNQGLGLDVADVSRFAGHKTPDVTWQVYVNSRPDRISRAREASKEERR